MSDDSTRDGAGRWLVPPKSPGRPRGPSAAEQMQLYLEPHRREILDKAISLAKAGDPVSLRLILDRISPIPKQDSERVHVPGLKEASTFSAKCEAVITAVADGVVSAEAGERVLRLLDVYRKAHETDALEARIATLEGRRPGPAAPADTAGTDDISDIC